MLSIVINMKIMKWYTMYIFFVDLGVVVYVDTEWVIWDFDTKIREKSWSWQQSLICIAGFSDDGWFIAPCGRDALWRTRADQLGSRTKPRTNLLNDVDEASAAELVASPASNWLTAAPSFHFIPVRSSTQLGQWWTWLTSPPDGMR